MDLQSVEKYVQTNVDKNFHFVDNRGKEVPFTRLDKPISEAKIAIISSAGLYVKGEVPFDTEDLHGDISFRKIPKDASMQDLEIAHTHYNHKYIKADINTVFPVAILKELENEGIIGKVPDINYSFSGYILKVKELMEETAVSIANLLKADNIDVVILAPV